MNDLQGFPPLRSVDDDMKNPSVSTSWTALPLQLELLRDVTQQLSLVVGESVDLSVAAENLWGIVLRVHTLSDHVEFGRIDEATGKSSCIMLDLTIQSAGTPITEIFNPQRKSISALQQCHSAIWLTSSDHDRSPNDDLPSKDCGGLLLQLHRNSKMAYVQGSLWHQLPHVSSGYARNILSSFHQATRCIAKKPTIFLEDLNLFSPENQLDVEQWNRRHLRHDFLSLPEICNIQVRQRPDTLAVCAWDGEWTYAELKQHAHSLASHLVALGVQEQETVLLRVEKSKWAVAGILAILMLGAVCAPTDIRHPLERLKQCIKVTSAKYMLCTKAISQVDFDLDTPLEQVLLPPTQFLGHHAESSQLPDILPDHVAYIFFTSGSTGKLER